MIIYGLMKKFQNSPNLLLFGIFLIISLLSTFLGMGTEFMPLIPLFMIISKTCGYDRIFGLALLAIPFSLGWTVALTNPFSVQIAQKIAEVPIGSGMGFRLILFVIILGSGYLYMMRYGKRVRKNKALSHMPEDAFDLPDDAPVGALKLEQKHILIVVVATILFATILFAVQIMGWGLIEVANLFVILSPK